MKAHFLFVPSEVLGYGRMGVKLAEALRAAGVEVNPELLETTQDRAQVASWASVPAHLRGNFKGQYCSILTMWEATRLPESMRENLDHLDLVMVPSQHNVELFGAYHDNVKFVPLGIDPRDWHYTPRMSSEDEFRFMVGGSGPRKGADLVVKAFHRLWGKPGSWHGPTPVLLLKTPSGRVVDCDDNDMPLLQDRMRVVPGRVGADEERELYEYAHCYVQPSRGEGFGLQPLQAIAQGLPTILTDAHGHASFAHLGIGLPSKLVPAAYFSHGFAGEWWEPSLDDLCDAMRYVYENYPAASATAQGCAQVAAREFTWAGTAQRWADAHDGMLDQDYDGTGEWVEPDPHRYAVITNRRWQANVAGVDFDIPPREEVWVPADVKRILFEGHHLDPVCLDDSRGLTESQLVNLDKQIARDAYCPTCQQRLNSQPTRSDDIYEELSR